MLRHGLARIILLACWQVLTGTIAKSAPEGLWLSVGFFENIFVPPHFMQDNTEWDAAQGLWVWRSDYGDANLDPGHGAVRFRVTNSIFREEQRPLEAPPAANADARDSGGQGEQPPFQVMASIKDDGLGLVMWWE
jgi:DNA-directed RNA polymerase III subunit RPC8